MNNALVNKVSESALTTLNLEDYYPRDPIMVFDMKDYLFMGLILKEKDFREALKQLNLEPYTGKWVSITCSADAVIPMWAYMLAASYLQPVAKEIFFGNENEVRTRLLLQQISLLDKQQFAEQKIVVKGCGELPIGEAAYLEITKILRPVAKSIMYGEPCSTVPIFKKK